MADQYPPQIIDRILRITLESQHFAWLCIDADGLLLSQGGALEDLGLPAWQPGENILDSALFLTGFLPLGEDYERVPSVHLSDEVVVDVHLFRDAGRVWIILADQTEALEWQTVAHQKGNELRLLQDQLRRLERNCDNGIDFFEALEMLALQRNEDGTFMILRPVNRRFIELYPELLDKPAELQPQHKFPFIENFLVDAEKLWQQPEDGRRLRSGPWIETDGQGREIPLEASALNWEGRNLLFIEMLDEAYEQHHSFLQIGREGELIKNMLEQEVRKRTTEIRRREEEIALRLVAAADSRDDGETGAHIRRLGLYSELLARHLGWPADKVEEIRIAAPMHDIGKIGIPDHILRKPSKLTADEFEIMKMHALIGGKILENSETSLVQMAHDIALYHHERWDGSGYPEGLRGEEIPEAARIVAIMDVFDALIHKRVYKDEIPLERAIQILREGRGKQFDPRLFDLFLFLREDMARIARDYVS
jgi:HD-GYP domain-containing protein (c-di-GMP phosphodiesterase class II)